MKLDPRAIMAARNNADLYVEMFRTHGLAFKCEAFGVVAHDTPLPFYADITISEPEQRELALRVLRRLHQNGRKRAVIKDSFCEIGPDAADLEPVFHAEWIWNASQAATVPYDWRRVDDVDSLASWQAAWNSGQTPAPFDVFPPAFLERSKVFAFARYASGAVTGGCIVNLSQDCVGLSNVFATTSHQTDFAGAMLCAHSLAPDKPLVGYERGEDLIAARAAGFETVGSLQVLMAR